MRKIMITRNLMLAAAFCLALPGCATTGGLSPAPLSQTSVDEQALTAAYSSLDVVLAAVDQLVILGKLPFGSPKALEVKDLIQKAQDGLNTARAVRDGLSQENPVLALASATEAFRLIAALLKGI